VKETRAGWHSWRMATTWATALVAAMLAPSIAGAEPCAPAAVVSGDRELAAPIAQLLAHDGVVGDDTPTCPALHVAVARRASALVVTDRERERVVSELGAAAAVIESWTVSDFDTPLLALHPVMAAHTAVAPEKPRIETFGDLETSIADDRTGWLGFAVGMCVQLGALCPSARVRFAAVLAGPEAWDHIERHSYDVVLGGDIPWSLGRTLLTFGFGAGFGATHTGIEEPTGMRGAETFGLRADAHVAWVVPLVHGIALDLSASVDAAQVTDVEIAGSSPWLADEPRMLARLGAGMRWSGR
jgi:hypothetical protein